MVEYVGLCQLVVSGFDENNLIQSKIKHVTNGGNTPFDYLRKECVEERRMSALSLLTKR